MALYLGIRLSLLLIVRRYGQTISVDNTLELNELDPSILLRAYANGLFPMGDDQSDEIDWYSPDPRAIIPVQGLKISKSLNKIIRQDTFTITLDLAFEKVITCCSDRSSTWITPEIIDAYHELFKLGFAHSVECWQDGVLVGGLYGVALGGAFFGESMFHRVADASKVALVGLVRHMSERGMELLDIQFMTSHLRSMGAIEIERDDYLRRLDLAIKSNASW